MGNPCTLVPYCNVVVHNRAGLDIITERISREKAGSLISVYFNLLSADVGGNMGLFLGCSLLTLCEFVDLIVIMCLQCWRKKNAVVHAREDQFR